MDEGVIHAQRWLTLFHSLFAAGNQGTFALSAHCHCGDEFGCEQNLSEKSWTKSLKSGMESFRKRTIVLKRLQMDFITHVQERMLAQLAEIMAEYEGAVNAASLSEMETTVKQMTHQVGNEVLRQWLEAQDQQYPDDERPCPHCEQVAKYVRRRSGMIISLQGRIYYRRTYYGCEHCQRGHYPLDQRLDIQAGEMSQQVVKLAGLLGVQDAFGCSSDLLARTTLLELSPNSIRKACQQIGDAVLESEQRLIAESQQLDVQLERQRAPDKPQRLYGSMDGFYVLLDTGWHEMKAGAWWQVDAAGKAQHMRYYVDTTRAEAFSDLVWATGFDQQADQAQELIFVADAAEWIWNIVEHHYPQAVQIVDWYHACQYLTPIATAAFKHPDQRDAWYEQVRTNLWLGQLDAVIAACQALVNPRLAREDDPAQQALTYYRNNRHRMDYPTYRDKDYQIGSGTMESACKQLGTARLKIAGARWSQAGARKVAKARATYLSDDWDNLTLSSQPLPQVA